MITWRKTEDWLNLWIRMKEHSGLVPLSDGASSPKHDRERWTFKFLGRKDLQSFYGVLKKYEIWSLDSIGKEKSNNS